MNRNILSLSFLLTEKKQKVKTAEGAHARRGMTVVFRPAAHYCAAACRLTQGNFDLYKVEAREVKREDNRNGHIDAKDCAK